MIDHAVNICIILNCLILGISLDMHPDSVWWYIIYAVLTFVFAVEQIERSYLQGLRGYLFGPTWTWNAFEGCDRNNGRRLYT